MFFLKIFLAVEPKNQVVFNSKIWKMYGKVYIIFMTFFTDQS
jgi:hypothetical protein